MKLVDWIKSQEGYDELPYLDTRGILTVGYGHNLIANPFTDEDAQQFFCLSTSRERKLFYQLVLEDDLAATTWSLAADLPWLWDKPENVRHGLISMAYQMGVEGLLKFENSLPLIKNNEMGEAAKHLRKSLWFEQTPDRARRVIHKITRVWV